jgi:DNA repair photolyase
VSASVPSLFDEALASPAVSLAGTQADISYLETAARSVLNPPSRTGMPYWSLNPYVGCAFGCAYCYARYAHRYVWERLGKSTNAVVDPEGGAMAPWLAFERRIIVKHNAADVVRSAFSTGRSKHIGLIRGESLVIGTATDPYQPAERRFRVTRGVLEALAEHSRLRVVVITKSPLVTRDIDVLARLAGRSRLTIHLSLITLDRDLARRIEPRAPTPEARLRALGRLAEMGLDVGVNIMPILPGITDQPAGLSALMRRVAELGATHVNAGPLRLQSEARKRYLPFIEAEFPHLASRYRAAYGSDYDIGARYRAGLARVIRQLSARYGLISGHFEKEMLEPALDASSTPSIPEQLALPWAQ